MTDFVPESTNALIVTQADVNDLDRAAVTRFHNIQIKRIVAGDKTLGDNRDVIEQAFARHRIEAERRALQPGAGGVRIYVRWSDDGQHIRHWSREPFKHGLSEAEPVNAVEDSQPLAIDPDTGRPVGDHGTGDQAIDFILNHAEDHNLFEMEAFLKAWQDGSAYEEWPEYYAWLSTQVRS